MSAADDLLAQVVAWAAGEADVRRLLLVGSRARAAASDGLADIDVQVYTVAPSRYTERDEWLREMGEVWVCVADQYVDGSVHVPTRLAIFDGGVKVDFAFYPAGSVSSGVGAGLAHKVLLDKDASGVELPAGPAPARPSGRPGEAEFCRVVEEFWFEAYHVAKYLARDELWLAKSRDWAMKQFLLAMIAWHEQLARGRVCDPDSVGTRTSMGADTWEALHGAFAPFAREASWDAAFRTMALFRRLAREVAAVLTFEYPADVDSNISGWISGVREAQSP